MEFFACSSCALRRENAADLNGSACVCWMRFTYVHDLPNLYSSHAMPGMSCNVSGLLLAIKMAAGAIGQRQCCIIFELWLQAASELKSQFNYNAHSFNLNQLVIFVWARLSMCVWACV